MKLLTGRVIYSLLFYILAILLIIVSKPTMIFDSSGSIMPFGVGLTDEGKEKTIFSIGVFVIVLAIVSFYIFAVLDVIFSSKT
jgi:hypothetical protein